MRIDTRVTLIFVLVVAASCVKDEIAYIDHAAIIGSLTYVDLITGEELPVPSGTTVKVDFQSKGDSHSAYSFKTTKDGEYSFKPQVRGDYTLLFSYTDSLLQYNSSLVRKVDLDTTRASSFAVIKYENSTEVTCKRRCSTNSRDLSLEYAGTALKLILTDELGNPLRDMRVCLYDNQSFLEANLPNCGGSRGYLRSDGDGVVVFAELEPTTYYINARGNVGSIPLSNDYAEEAQSSGELVAGELALKEIVLK